LPKKRTLKLGIFYPSYGGNGATSGLHTDIAMWLLKTVKEAKADDRIDPEIWIRTIADTPITMTRNAAVLEARAEDVDVLIMVDSDQRPDCELGEDPAAKPFFQTSFDFIYRNWDKGPHVVCAPYCGPPPHECVYVFHWKQDESGGQDIPHALEMYPREHAAVMAGIQECAAQPTGLIMFDMRAFDLTDPKHHFEALIEEGFSREHARLIARPWFYYEYRSAYEAQKGSTEDVTATRDMSLAGINQLGYNPMYCNWDAWAGHHKPKCVRKPRPIMSQHVGGKYREMLKRGIIADARLKRQFVDFTENIEQPQKPKHFLVREELDPIQKFNEDPRLSGGFGGLGSNGHAHDENGDPRANRGMRDDSIFRFAPMFTPAGDLWAVEKLASRLTDENPLIVEVGSWVGETALALNRGCPQAHIHCVDTWRGSPSDLTSAMAVRYGRNAVLGAFVKNTEGKPIQAKVGTSKGAAAEWSEPIDMLFIDAEHTYEALKSDIEAWWPHLKPGGILAIHDYRDAQFPGVTKAFDEKFGSAVVHEYPSTVAWVVKDGEAAGAHQGAQEDSHGREGHQEPSGNGAVL
jgi:predicted O-methyltransferase YrrM